VSSKKPARAASKVFSPGYSSEGCAEAAFRSSASEIRVTLRLAIAPLQPILNPLIRQYPVLIRDEARPHFRDVYDHAARLNEATDTMREMLSFVLKRAKCL
jgi:hypothetical protein